MFVEFELCDHVFVVFLELEMLVCFELIDCVYRYRFGLILILV